MTQQELRAAADALHALLTPSLTPAVDPPIDEKAAPVAAGASDPHDGEHHQ